MDILSLPAPSADHRIPYGPDPSQFGDLWLPEASPRTKFPVIAFFHGGWWKSAYTLDHAGHLCAGLRREGIAVWSIEYRRVGDTGGGWPATFHDAAAGFDFLTTLALTYPFDLSRVITMGHSAGGHLAFWTAGRANISSTSELYLPLPAIDLLGTISLAGAVDLHLTLAAGLYGTPDRDGDEIQNLMGGLPADVPERYRAANPGELLPFAPQRLLQGTRDDQIPAELPHQWCELSRRHNSDARARILDDIDHLDLIDPRSGAWPVVRDEVADLLKAR